MKKRILVPLFICVIVIILVSIVNARMVYLGSNTKALSIGNKVFKFDNNISLILRKANIYKNGKKLKGYLKSEKSNGRNEYYAVSQNNNRLDLDLLIASGSLKTIDVYTVKTDMELDAISIGEINSLLDTDISNNELYSYSKIVKDIDNDSVDEEVIFALYGEEDSTITNIFVVDNDNAYEIVKGEYTEETEYNHKTYNLVGLIDFNGNGNYEIIVSRIDGDSQPTYYNIYRYENGTVKEIE